MISPTNYYQAMKKHTHKKFTSVIEIFQNKIIMENFYYKKKKLFCITKLFGLKI